MLPQRKDILGARNRGGVPRKEEVMGLVYTVPGRPQLGHHNPRAPHSVREADEKEEGISAGITMVQRGRKCTCALFKGVLVWVPPEADAGTKI